MEIWKMREIPAPADLEIRALVWEKIAILQ
jgi:hypothetical protein